MTGGYLVLRDRDVLKDVVARAPMETVESVALAYFPDSPTQCFAEASARLIHGEKPFVVISYADAQAEVRRLTQQRRSKAAAIANRRRVTR